MRVLDQGLDKRKESGTEEPLETLVISDADGMAREKTAIHWSWGGGKECAGGQAQRSE